MKKILVILLVALVLIQFFPIDKNNPAPTPGMDLLKIKNTPEATATLIRNGCYDCHSNETVYPNYAYVAPISWSVKHHINEGREHLNFSEWGKFNKELKQNMLENAIHSVKDYSMPLPAYIPYHPEANLTKAERDLIAKYFQEILDRGNY